MDKLLVEAINFDMYRQSQEIEWSSLLPFHLQGGSYHVLIFQISMITFETRRAYHKKGATRAQYITQFQNTK